MTLILRPFRQSGQPGGDLDNQHDKPDPKHPEQPVASRPQHGLCTHPPTTMKATTAIHTQALSWSPAIARDPKNDVVIAAAAIITPARDRAR